MPDTINLVCKHLTLNHMPRPQNPQYLPTKVPSTGHNPTNFHKEHKTEHPKPNITKPNPHIIRIKPNMHRL